MSMHSGMGPVWRHMRTDRSVVGQKLARETVRRVVGFARPHRALIAAFLVLVVIDSALVVVTPLLVQRIVDDGILKGDAALVTWLSLGIAAVAVLSALLSLGQGYLSSQIGEGLIVKLAKALESWPASCVRFLVAALVSSTMAAFCWVI